MDSEALDRQSAVASWLSDLVTHDVANGPIQDSVRKAPSQPHSPPPSAHPSSTPPHLHELRGRRRKRKRDRSMSELSVLSQRLILTPKSPSRHRSRSQSPVRNLRTLLAAATPAVRCQQVSEAVLPEYISVLKVNLLSAREEGVIPIQLKHHLKITAPNEFDDIDESCFDTRDTFSLADSEDLYFWARVKEIHRDAEACQRYQKDENAWVKTVMMVLDTAKRHSKLEMLEVTSIQTQSIDPQHLPTLANSPTPFHKKADVAFCFTPDHDDVRELRHRVGGVPLSHMTDPYTKIVPMSCGIEVKGSGGNRDEAIVQFGIWAAAGLAKVVELFDGATLLQPLLGWTVVGHDWMLHMAWKLPNGDVKFDCGTDTYEGIFKLLHLISQVGKWLEKDYWTWFSVGVSEVQDRLYR